MSNPTRSQEDITTGLMALVAWAGNPTAASKALKSEGKLDITPQTLNSWAKERYPEQYAELRERFSEQMERELAHEYRNAARRAVEVQLLGLEKAAEKLDQNRDQDPSRTAANAATVADKMTGKLLALTGRPTSIREDRNIEQILRSLAAKGVIQVPDADVQETGEPATIGPPPALTHQETSPDATSEPIPDRGASGGTNVTSTIGARRE